MALLDKVLGSSLLKASGIYSITNIINASIPFLLLPILTRLLQPEDYGIVSMAAILINIVTPFMGMSAQGAVQRKYFETDSGHFAKYVGNVFYLLLASIVIFTMIFLLFNGFISDSTGIPGKWLYVVLMVAICQFISLINLVLWQNKTKAIYFGAFKIGQSVINFGLTLLLVYYINLDWEGRILGQLGAAFVGGVFSVIYMLKKKLICFKYDIEDIKDILRFSLPLIPHTLGGLLLGFTDRVLITNIIGMRETGIYTVAFQVGSVLGLFTSSFNSAYIPWLYGKLKKNEWEMKVKIVKFTYLYFAIILIGGILSPFILPKMMSVIVGSSYKGAEIYTFWIVMGYVFNGMYLMVTGFVFYSKRTGMLSKVTMSAALINIPLCYWLLLQVGTIGAAISTAIVFAISFIFTWVLSAKVYPMPWFTFRKPKEEQ